MDIKVRQLSKKDYNDLKSSMAQAYQSLDEVWTRENIVDLIDIFPEGQLCVEVDGRVVACALSLMLNSKKANVYDSYYEIVDDRQCSKQDCDSDVLYGIEVF